MGQFTNTARRTAGPRGVQPLFGPAVQGPSSRQVFALRKAGELDRAVEMARALFAGGPHNEWVVRAYAWCLVDLVKRSLGNRDESGARTHFTALSALTIPAGDTILNSQLEWCRGRVERKIEKIKDVGEAAQQRAGNAGEQTSLGWEIVRRLKELEGAEKPDGEAVARLLGAYRKLDLIPRPGLLASMVLLHATNLSGALHDYAGFVRWWDLRNLRAEDYVRYQVPGARHACASLLEKVCKELQTAVKNVGEPAVLEYAAAVINGAARRFPDNEWLPYYEGKLLNRLGRRIEARALILPLIRKKQSEFWAWEVLASTCVPDEGALRKACLCRAMLCHVKDEALRIHVRSGLAAVFKSEGNAAAAKHEYEEVRGIREAHGWGVSSELQEVESEAWYAATEKSANNRSLYERAAGEAGEILIAGLPWVNGILSGLVPASDGREMMAFIAVVESGNIVQYRVKPGCLPSLVEIKRGAPLKVKLDRREQGTMVAAAERRDGQAWDLVPARAGVVVHRNEEKALVRVLFGAEQDRVVLVHFKDFPDAVGLLEGDTVALKALHHAGKDRWVPVSVEKSAALPSAQFCRVVSDRARIADGGFAFAGDVFISPPQVNAWELVDGAEVRVLAVREWVEKKKAFGWRAVRLEPPK